MAWIRPERVTHALRNIGEWRKSVHDQGARHLPQLLALLEKGAGNGGSVHFDETPHEYDFWDRYFRLNGSDPDMPYFNPILAKTAESGHPHSNAATIRKKTFAGMWQAATRTVTPNGDNWQLAPTYADIAREKMLTKKGIVTRAPVLDLAVVLFRSEEVPTANATANELERRFRERFPQTDADYQKMFEFRPEEPGRLFLEAGSAPSYDDAIRAALMPEESLVAKHTSPAAADQAADPDDPVLLQVKEILAIGTSGIILKGPPGTGKTHHAHSIAASLVGDTKTDVFRVQFHPSYGYEDFVEGYRPDDRSTSGFEIVDKIFVRACSRAEEVQATNAAKGQPAGYVILIVDEINRGDPARIFGELLTYLEWSYRSVVFNRPFSGKALSVPANLLLIGTMNQFDRSVSHLDAAFVRRFDHIDIDPSREVAEMLLEKSGGFTPEQIGMIGDWFDSAQQQLAPIGLGHSFFKDVNSVDRLRTIWRYRIRPTAESLLDLGGAGQEGFAHSFDALIQRLEGVVGAP